MRTVTSLDYSYYGTSCRRRKTARFLRKQIVNSESMQLTEVSQMRQSYDHVTSVTIPAC
jgi:hypothetical protein